MNRTWLVLDATFLGILRNGQLPARPRRAELQPDSTTGQAFSYEGLKFENRQEAEDVIENLMLQFPERKYILFESIFFFEVVPQPPIRKSWDENGGLVIS